MAPSTKRGLGWPWDNQETAFKPYQPAISKHDLTWLFNWEMWKPAGLPAALNYVPQVRTAEEAPKIDQFLTTLGAGNISHFIGFNEPDNASQAHLAPATAAALWRQHVLPAKAKYHFRLGTPAITNAPAGKAWLQAFFAALGGAEHAGIDFVVVHWYGRSTADLEHFVDDMHATFGAQGPLWLNEFACTTFGGAAPAEAEVTAFEREALRMLDAKAFVERYAWFGAAANAGSLGGVAPANMLAKGDQLTAVGKIYCGDSSPARSQIKVQSRVAVAAAAATTTKPGVHLTNKSNKAQTYNFFNNFWNGDGTAGANFDHPEKPTHLAPGETAFVELPPSFKGRVQRGTLIPATWIEFQVSADRDHKAWGDVSLEQGYDGPAVVRAADGSRLANGFTNEILAGAPKATKQMRSDGVECIASTMGNWLGGRNQAAIDYEKRVVGQKKAYIEGGSGTDVVSSKNNVLDIDFY